MVGGGCGLPGHVTLDEIGPLIISHQDQHADLAAKEEVFVRESGERMFVVVTVD